MKKWMTLCMLSICLMLYGCGQKEDKEIETAMSLESNLVSDVDISTEESEQADYPAMIMVQGKLYYDSDEISTEPRCGNLDGEITSDTASEPTEDNQSNFGTGYGYQYWSDDTIHVNIDNSWHIFIPYGEKSEDWNNLTEQQKMEQDPTYNADKK